MGSLRRGFHGISAVRETVAPHYPLFANVRRTRDLKVVQQGVCWAARILLYTDLENTLTHRECTLITLFLKSEKYKKYRTDGSLRPSQESQIGFPMYLCAVPPLQKGSASTPSFLSLICPVGQIVVAFSSILSQMILKAWVSLRSIFKLRTLSWWKAVVPTEFPCGGFQLPRHPLVFTRHIPAVLKSWPPVVKLWSGISLGIPSWGMAWIRCQFGKPKEQVAGGLNLKLRWSVLET